MMRLSQFRAALWHWRWDVPTRTYIAVLAVDTALLGQRPTVSGYWNTSTVAQALVGDAMVLLALYAIYRAVDARLAPDSLRRRLHRAAHVFIGATILIFSCLAQMLFLKTGESLDLAILSFAVRSAADLASVVSQSAGSKELQVVMVCLGLSALTLLGLRGRVLRSLRLLALGLPMITLLAHGAVDLAHDEVLTFEVPPEEDGDERLYLGQYLQMTQRQQGWNVNPTAAWRQGIISALTTNNLLSRAEYQSLWEGAGKGPRHEPVRFVGQSGPRPNVVFVLLESFRWDMVGAYGGRPGEPSLTPYIDALASRSWRVERAYTTIPHTSKALVGIYCGAFARFDTTTRESEPGGLHPNCLPHLLGRAGYRSAHFQTAPATFEDRAGFLQNAGFDHYTTMESFEGQDWATFGYLGMDDRAMLVPSLAWMSERKVAGEPFFASLLTVVTHHPYAIPGRVVPISDARGALESYQHAVTYTDALVRDLVAGMERLGLLDDTLLVITGDHGEAFMEHGQIAHNGTPYEEGKRVPMLLHAPKLLPGAGIIGGLRQHLDLYPTVLGLAGVQVDGGTAGRDLREAAGHEQLLTSCFYQDYCLVRVTAAGMKSIYYYGKRVPEVYDLNADPGEDRNLAPAWPADSLREELLQIVQLRRSWDGYFDNARHAAR